MNGQRRAAIVGVTGFLGRGLPRLLAEKGVHTTGLSRNGVGNVDGVDRWQNLAQPDLAGHEIVINLAGAPINRRWTESAKQEIRESRVGTTARLVAAISRLPEAERPKVLVNGSAVGIYGDCGDDILTEAERPGSGFLADLCADWEDAALDAESLGVRVVLMRTGVVLGRGGAAFEQLRRVFNLGIGGRLGSGKQWMPWIHLEDWHNALIHSAVSSTRAGPINGTAPYPERNRDLTRKLAEALHRPAVLPVPGFALQLLLGDFATALLDSQRVIPAALDKDGFQFQFPTLEKALADLVD